MNNSYLAHHGIKGQKWGVRRFQNPDGTLTAKGQKRYSSAIATKSKSGEDIYLLKQKTPAIAKVLSKVSPSIKDNVSRNQNYDAFVNGKKIGEMELYRESKVSMNGVWLGVAKRERGKGYATAILDQGLKIAKNEGAKQFTLEVPGNSPDARHIYEKKGFKETKVLTTPDEDILWGGLTGMKKRL